MGIVREAGCLARPRRNIAGQRLAYVFRAIAEDFAEFRKAGLTHPMMAEIERELGVFP